MRSSSRSRFRRSGSKRSSDDRKRHQALSVVRILPRSVPSPKASLPTKLMRLTPVTSPSLISKTRSTRPCSRLMILGSTDGVVATAAAIDGQDALDVGLHARARVDLARLRLHFVAQLVVVDLAVSLEGDAIDDRILRDLHDQGRALHLDHDVGEQAGREQRLQRAIGRGRVERLAVLQLKVGADRLRLRSARCPGSGWRQSCHRRGHGAAALGVCRRAESQNCGDGQYSPTKDQTSPRRLQTCRWSNT